MSVTLDYFFNSPKPLWALVADLRQWIGCDLQPYEGDPDDLYCRFLGMEFNFGRHDLEVDRELDFNHYQFQIGIRTPWPDAEFRPHQLFVMASLVHAMHRRLGVAGMLVYDVCWLLARYEERTDPETDSRFLFDAVSNEPVVFPRHFAELWERLPEDAKDGWEASFTES